MEHYQHPRGVSHYSLQVIAIWTSITKDLYVCSFYINEIILDVVCVPFCSALYLRCSHVHAHNISFSVLHSIPLEDYTTNVSLLLIDIWVVDIDTVTEKW